MSNTLFFNPLLQAFTTNTPTSFYSRYSDDFNPTVIAPVDQKKIQSVPLNLSDTYAFTPGDLSLQDGCIIIAKVVGSARIKVIGTDLGSSVTGYLPTYGTEIFPGYINLSTFNATSFEILGQSNGTVVDLFLGYAGGAVGFNGTFSFIFDGQGFSTTQTVTVTYFKVGRQVTLDFPGKTATGAASGVAYITGTGTIPSTLWPAATAASLDAPSVITIDNGSSFSGAIDLTTGGSLRVYKNVTETGNFTNNATIGWNRFTMTYLTAS